MSNMRAYPTPRQLQHLLALAEHENFSRAAEACFITQSTMSASIKELETLLGAVLVERTKRQVRLTALGREVVARARAILRGLDDLYDLVAAAGEPLSQPVRLGVIPTIGPYLLPRVLPALRKAYPKLKLFIHEEETADILEALEQGDLDLGLLAFPYDVGPALKTMSLAQDPFFLAAPQDHPLGKKERVRPTDLAGETLLLLEEGHCLRDHALAACNLPTAFQSEEFRVTSLMTPVQMVENDLGVTLLPKMAIDAGLVKGMKLILRPMEGPDRRREIGLAWRKTSVRGEEYALLGELFQDELGTPLRPEKTARG